MSLFPEFLALKAESGLGDAVYVAARRNRMSRREWMRRAVRQALLADGVTLPPFRDVRESTDAQADRARRQ